MTQKIRKARYELEDSGEPFVIADDLRIILYRDMGMILPGVSRNDLEQLWSHMQYTDVFITSFSYELPPPTHTSSLRPGLRSGSNRSLTRWGLNRANYVLKYGAQLALETFRQFKKESALPDDKLDKLIGHQVGGLHHQQFYAALGLDMAKDFSTFPFLGNVGTVSLHCR